MCTPIELDCPCAPPKDGVPNADRCRANTQGCKNSCSRYTCGSFRQLPFQLGSSEPEESESAFPGTRRLGTAGLHPLVTLVGRQGLTRSLCSGSCGSYLCPQAHGGQGALNAAPLPSTGFQQRRGVILGHAVRGHGW